MSILEFTGLIVALAALHIAWTESRRNSIAIMKLVSAQGSTSSCIESGGALFSELNLVFKNVGATLHNPRVWLKFEVNGGTDFGSRRFEIPPDGVPSTEPTALQRGMIARFRLQTFRYTQDSIRMMSGLRNLAKQKVRIQICSGEFLVAEFQIPRLRDRFGRLWNRIAWKIKFRFERVVGKNAEGMPVIKCPNVPMMTDLLWAVQCFAESIQHAQQSKAA